MSQFQIILIIIGVTAAWMLYKRFVKKEPLRKDWSFVAMPDVENWYSEAQDKIAALSLELREEKETGWQALSKAEKQEFSDEFIRNRFGQKAVSGYSPDQRLKIGLAHYLIKTDQ